MIGMTGYSFHEEYFEDQYISTEIKTVNHRFLDISFHIPTFLSPLELQIKDLIGESFIRGKVDVTVYLRLKNFTRSIKPDLELAAMYYESLKELSDKFNLDEPTLETLLKYDVITTEVVKDYEEYWPLVKRCIEKNIACVNEMRLQEGESTKRNVLELITVIKENINIIKSKIPEMEKAVFVSFSAKMKEFVGDLVDNDRLLNEVGVLVTKSCINEEIERLLHHISHFNKVVENGVDAGKKLDFICQEMHREINTMGSKAVLPFISESVITVKNNIEKIREQIRNIE